MSITIDLGHFLKFLGIFPWPHDHFGVLGTSEIKGSSLLRFPTLTRRFQHDLCTPNLLCPLKLWQLGGGLLDRKLPKLLAYLVSSSIPKKSWLGCHYSHG